MSLELIKENVSQIGRNFEEFKAAVEKSRKDGDVLIEEKIKKLSDDITAKHEATQRELDRIAAEAGKPKDAAAKVDKAVEDAEVFRRDWLGVKGEYARGAAGPDADTCARYSKAFARYMRVDDKMMAPDQLKDLQVGTDPSGGYWITPPTISREVIRRVFETSPMRKVASVMPIGTREYILPEDPNDVGAGWVAETGPVSTTTTMQVTRRTITAFEEYAMPAVTTQMLEDSLIDIEGYLASKIADKLARVQNTAFVNGSGQGQPRGLLTYAAGSGTSVWGSQIVQVGTGSSGAFTYNGLINLITSIKDKYQANAQFLIRRQSIASVMELVDGNGRLIFQPLINGAFNETPLLGYPINYAADMPAVGAGALALAFGDFKAGYQIVDRVGMSTIRDNLTAKPNVLFYTRTRVGGDVIDFDAFVIQVLT